MLLNVEVTKWTGGNGILFSVGAKENEMTRASIVLKSVDRVGRSLAKKSFSEQEDV